MPINGKSNSPNHKNSDLTICLCGVCLSDFYNLDDRIRRENLGQPVKEKCQFCQHRLGYNYIISDRGKQK